MGIDMEKCDGCHVSYPVENLEGIEGLDLKFGLCMGCRQKLSVFYSSSDGEDAPSPPGQTMEGRGTCGVCHAPLIKGDLRKVAVGHAGLVSPVCESCLHDIGQAYLANLPNVGKDSPDVEFPPVFPPTETEKQLGKLVDMVGEKLAGDIAGHAVPIEHATTAEKKPLCGTHSFERLHKDHEHAMLFCARCGLVRVIELELAADGKLPVLDIPTPVAMPADWPKLGAGLEDKEHFRKGEELVRRVGDFIGEKTKEGDPPAPRAIMALEGEIIDWLEDCE